MIVGIREIILSIIFVNPGCLMEIFQSFHELHRAIQLHHIIFQLTSFTGAATAIIDIRLPVVIYKDTRVNHRIHPFNISLHFESFRRFIAGSHSDLPTVVPVCFTGMRKIKIVSAVFISTIRSPHKSSFFASPWHLIGA